MASPLPATVPEVTAEQVGSYFVGQYYQVMQQQPDFLHQFYTQISSMTRIDGKDVETSEGMLQIHTLLISLNFTSIEIKTAHSMDSWRGGVLVVVSGSVQIRDAKGRRKFVQTFFLAPQDKGYFVLNDIFQFYDEEPPFQHSPSVMDHGSYDPSLHVASYDSNQNVPSYDSNAFAPSKTEPANDYSVESDVQEDEFVPTIYSQESEAADKHSICEPTPEIPEVDARIEEEVKVEEPSPSHSSSLPVNATFDAPSVPIEESFEEPVKHTYASILLSKTHHVMSASQPSIAKSTPVVSEWDQPPQQSPQSTALSYYAQQSAVSEKFNVAAPEDTSAFDDEGEVTSVYVRNLPSSASASELEQEFRNFGRLKPGGVLIKSRKEANVLYAFVEFEDLSGVQNAVKASPLLYQGKQIFVEERRPNSGGVRGRRGRGRGGYQIETSRGGRGFGRRGSMQDSKDHTKTRGNGLNPQRANPRQERGILGSQGTRNGSQYNSSS